MKKLILVLVSGLLLTAASYANDKGNVFNTNRDIPEMGNSPFFDLRVSIYTPLCAKEILRS